MLMLTRKPGQILRITPRNGPACALTVGDLFADGPMEIVVRKIDRSQVRIGLYLHRGLLVMRGEIEGTELADLLRQRGR